MSIEVLKSKAEIQLARRELQRRRLSFTSPWWKKLARKTSISSAIDVGDELKSWDVLKTVHFIERNISKSDPILDMGAFACEILCIMHNLGYSNLAGIDLNPDVKKMPYADAVRYHVANFMHTQFESESFRVISAISVIEHGFNSSQLLAEISRLLRPGGYFIASFDYWPDKLDTSGISFFGMDWTIFSEQEVRRFLDEAKSYNLAPLGGIDLAGCGNPDKMCPQGVHVRLASVAEKVCLSAHFSSSRPISQERMRILLISGSLPPMRCGVGDYTGRLAKALGRCQETFVAVLTDAAAQPVPPDFDFEVFPIIDGWRMRNILRIAKVVRRWHPDVIHIQYPTQGYGRTYLPWLLPALFRMANVPVVQTWHEYHMETVRRNLLNAVLGGGLVVVRPDYKAKMPNWYRWLIRRKTFGFIPNASAIPPIRLSDKERVSIRSRFASPPMHLVVYFGFAYPPKRVELLFEIADPSQHRLVLIGDLSSKDEYHKSILDRANQAPWIGKVTVTGFLPGDEVGRVLAAADAVVLPFRDGGGMWNTSLHAAVKQGTFVLTTANDRHGYDASCNIYYARPDDVVDMRSALRTHIGSRKAEIGDNPASEWDAIADAHRVLYTTVL